MRFLVHHLIERAAAQRPRAHAVTYRGETLSYAALWEMTRRVAAGFAERGIGRRDRVAVYLEKRVENVAAMFGAAAGGAVFVPVNPVLRALQVGHILRDCGVRMLVTSKDRLALLGDELRDLPALRTIVVVDATLSNAPEGVDLCTWFELCSVAPDRPLPAVLDADIAAILYTSGSTGMAKGVVLSHRNLVAGAESVNGYLPNREGDKLLAVLPLSFDAGLSQLTTAFAALAEVVLLNYLLPQDVVRACEKHRVTGLTGVPPLYIQLARESWPAAATASLRYFASTGGTLPRPTLDALRKIFPRAKPYLMYGLTEAFRSTYLDPEEIDARPDSIGKAIPNAEVLVVGEGGRECEPGEVGELVHRGALVSLGYWNDAERTAQRFRPAPGKPAEICAAENAVWSGDLVRRDADGFLDFVGRDDEMIKTSGYRVSPTEVEDAVVRTGLAREAVAFGIPDDELGQAILVVAVPQSGAKLDVDAILVACRTGLPPYMVPAEVRGVAKLPRTANGKVDRKALRGEFAGGRGAAGR